MRLDKLISNLWYWSRKEVSKAIKKWFVGVNSEIITQADYIISFWDKVHIWDDIVEYKEFIYLILNKPKWYVCSKKNDGWHTSYLELLEDCPYWEIVNIVWRLDFDTSWIVFLTNDWDLSHNIITPKKDIPKKYKAKTLSNLSDKDIEKLENWVKINTDSSWTLNYLTKKAIVERISDKEIYITITEWKFHQIKKMIEAVWNTLTKLERLSIWSLELNNLESWKWRYLNDDEIEQLKDIIK